ncbi:hypothetical protein NIIDMKKI_07610 [Mycobacterium kansasii]|uniref:Cyclase family protein n=1 Tax=Mycobacterium kansasii TaxID=1768 RepID=A0A7G1I6Z3_MYCKA|nr:hypothetical protein NIIDMKKI_07610 [Mycobacterium kansasii]
MASLTEFRRVASDLSNWGRWGDTDELGTLNFITADTVRHAASLVRHGKVFPLGVDFGSSGPQGAFGFRHNPIHVMTVDGGDANTLGRYGPGWTQNPTAEQMGSYLVDNPFRFNDDMVIMPLQAATQWDALSHVYYDDLLYNGFPAGSVTSLGPSTAASTRSMSRASPRVACYWTWCVIAVRKSFSSMATRSLQKSWTTSFVPKASPSAAATSC